MSLQGATTKAPLPLPTGCDFRKGSRWHPAIQMKRAAATSHGPRAYSSGGASPLGAYSLKQPIRHSPKVLPTRAYSGLSLSAAVQLPCTGQLAANSVFKPQDSQPSFPIKIHHTHKSASVFVRSRKSERNGGWFACVKKNETNAQRIFA